MADSISRKQFLHEIVRQTARFAADLAQTLLPASDTRNIHINHAFEADFPPELLAEEARKLGLDPNDKECVLMAISEKLKPQI